MKIDLSKINKDDFYINEKNFNGEIVYLVFPKNVGVKWTNDNLIFRSSVWNKEGELISASYKKFFNWQEQPDIDPPPYNIGNCNLLEKIDGSTLIISCYKNNLIIRTRGSIDTFTLANHHEIDLFKQKYPKIFDFNNYCQSNCSYIYEWVSPENRIVLNYSEPDLYLTNVITHSNYTMFQQSTLNQVANGLGVKRPKVFKFNTINEMIDAVKEFKGLEGICVYYSHDQNIRKLKAIEYLTLHRFRFDLTIESVLDMFLKYNQPDYNSFIKAIADEFDWECVEFCRGLASKICDASVEVKKILSHMKFFADSVRKLSRKDAAMKIIESYGKTSRSSFVFNLLDNKPIDNDGIKKLYFQVIKNS